MKYITTVNDKEFTIEVVDEKHIIVNGKKMVVDFESVSGQPVFSMIMGGKSFEAYVNPGEENWEVLLRGRLYTVKVEDEREKRLRAAAGGKAVEGGEYHLKAPMPGLVVAIPVSEGQKVEKGQVLVILESMKMQNELKSPKAGTVSRIKIKTGDRVEQKATMISVI